MQMIQDELFYFAMQWRYHSFITLACFSSRYLKVCIQWLWMCWVTVFLVFSFFFFFFFSLFCFLFYLFKLFSLSFIFSYLFFLLFSFFFSFVCLPFPLYYCGFLFFKVICLEAKQTLTCFLSKEVLVEVIIIHLWWAARDHLFTAEKNSHKVSISVKCAEKDKAKPPERFSQGYYLKLFGLLQPPWLWTELLRMSALKLPTVLLEWQPIFPLLQLLVCRQEHTDQPHITRAGTPAYWESSRLAQVLQTPHIHVCH